MSVSAHRKVVTVLFCDVVGSTALGESVDPEALQGLLARYFERMQGIVESHGGSVEKFIGDAVMAVFGVPVAHEDDALRACRAAVEMRDALPELGLEEPNRLHIQESLLRQVAHGSPLTAKKKRKSDVRATSAKMYRQKGTGRARQGERTNPHFVGGGLAFPPTPRINRKPIALLSMRSPAGGSWPEARVTIRLCLPPTRPALASTSSASEPTSVIRIAVRTIGSFTSYPRRSAIAPTIRVAWM